MRRRCAAVLRRRNRDRRDEPAHLVDDQRRERVARDVLAEDQQRLAGGDQLVEQRQELVGGAQPLARDGDVGVLEHGLHALGVGDHVRRDVAPAKAHALDQLQLEARPVVRLDGDDAVLADGGEGVADHLAERRIVGRDRRHPDHLLPVRDLPRLLLAQVRDHLLDRPLDPAPERNRLGACGDDS